MKQQTDRSDHGPVDAEPVAQRPLIGSVVLTGVIIIAVFVGGFTAWSTLLPIESASIASGLVTVEKGRQTVAHLEGGVVGEILVREGERVEAGQPLIRLQDTHSHAALELLLRRQLVALAQLSRLASEYEGLTSIKFPEELAERRHEQVIDEILRGQEKVFKTRTRSVKNRKAILQQRIVQLREEIAGLKAQIEAGEVQLALINEEIGMVEKMLKQGYADKPRLLLLKRRESEIEGRQSKHRSDIARASQNIGETQLRIDDIDTSQITEVAEKLRGSRGELYDLNERIRAARDVYERTEIVAQISGTVVSLNANTVGGVIRPGEPLLDIVPVDERLVVEAKVVPADIDVVHQGMDTKVRFTAYSQRSVLPMLGTVQSVSADHIVDQSTGTTYYLARIVLDDGELADRTADLRPGMEAEVIIITGERTFLQYMLEPLLKSFNRSFRET